MKAIKIDADNCTVYEIEINDNNVLKEWYKHIKCELVCVGARLDHINSLIVDDEGALKDNTTAFSMWTPFGIQMFIGNGLIVGTNRDGESISTTANINNININFHKIY